MRNVPHPSEFFKEVLRFFVLYYSLDQTSILEFSSRVYVEDSFFVQNRRNVLSRRYIEGKTNTRIVNSLYGFLSFDFQSKAKNRTKVVERRQHQRVRSKRSSSFTYGLICCKVFILKKAFLIFKLTYFTYFCSSSKISPNFVLT